MSVVIIEIGKQTHAYKGYASTYNVDILHNPELQLKNADAAINNKLNYLLSELRGFKFMTLILEF